MRFVADLHIHSKYARATSKDMNVIELDRWADDKGIQVMGTGDFTHPAYFKELTEQLEPAEAGLYKLKKGFRKKTLKNTAADTRFMLTVEISSIYTRGGRTRRIHNLVFAPSLEDAARINTELSHIGNIKSDGRPILGLDSEELANIVFNLNDKNVIIPAHAWTPWFSVFGSMSGFDSIEECFGRFSREIFAIETGLSSDPPMNWRLSALDTISLISNSDSHSLQRIGREANIFDTERSFDGIIAAIKNGAPSRRRGGAGGEAQFLATIEFFPEEGKYHYDGHRACRTIFSPEETAAHKGICPRCGKRVTVGVANRVSALADRTEEDARALRETRVPYYNMIPLYEVIGAALGVGPSSRRVKEEYEKLINEFGNELHILLDVPVDEALHKARPEVALGIQRVREGRVSITPGHDGEYGVINIFDEAERDEITGQDSLF